ncbi:MAG: nicotinate-nucleotide diphosphorylase, partial [Pirellulaceae bacterium]|nr:nicotinate-nucleotide diphosphorylase [Pirellulaceae bacterium]
MTTQFHQIEWDDRLARDWASLLTLAIAEDLGASGDWTSKALIPEMAAGRAEVVARRPGVVAGLAAMPQTAAAFHPGLKWNPAVEDGATVAPGNAVGSIEGPLRGILAAERVLLNLLGRLSGIATLTRRCVEAVAGTNARIYDTRKTTPGWRRLEKYAVRRGGGWNHRGGLDEAVLIKDNHLAIVGQVANLSHTNSDATGLVGQVANLSYDPAEAVRRARDFVRRHAIEAEMPIEIELDSLDRFDDVLTARPDIVLLDNMTPSQLREAVARRNAVAPAVELEASGGISLDTIRAVAESGVERISIGALTHSAVSLDFGLDWRSVYGYS